MQTQVLVQPPPLLAFVHQSLPRFLPVHHRRPLSQPLDPSPSPNLDEEQPPTTQSAPSDSTPTLHLLLDHPPRSGPRDRTSLTSSPRQCSISVSNLSLPTPHFPPARLVHPRTHSPPDSATRPTTETEQSAHIPPSPSPPNIPSFPPPYSAPHHLDHFASSETSCPPNMDRYSIMNLADRYLRATDKYSHNQQPILDQRRMSEPAMYGSAAATYTTNSADLPNTRYHQLQHHYSCAPPRSLALHSSSLHRSPVPLPITTSSWKEDNRLSLRAYDPVELEEPLSPLNPTFSGGESSSMSGVMFGSFHEDYGPSPPNTGTSTSSNAPVTHQQTHTAGGSSSPTSNKQYSFVSLAGNAVKKRPRRRYDQIERLYQCSWPNCTKAYGTLNHLNAHITMQKHGPKRSPNEFKELRKQWRKAKKEEAEARALEAVRNGSYRHQYPTQQNTSRHSTSDMEYQTNNVCPPVEYAPHPERPIQHISPLDDIHDSLAHQRDVQPRRSQRYSPFASPHLQHSGSSYPHPHAHSANPSNITVNRLPTNSTLLTPLPGYESSMNGPSNFGSYDSSYLYRGDSRPTTGHGGTVGHGDRGRPRSGHTGLNAGHNHDGP